MASTDATDPTRTLSTPGGASRGSEPGQSEPGPSGPRVALPERYELGASIGRGGFGTVYAARDRLHSRDIAVKVISFQKPNAARIYQREVSALRLLDLPGVVQLLDSGESGGTTWFAMERVDGVPFPGGPTPMPWVDLEGTTLEILRSLERIHRAGFTHGDLKPANVLVTRARTPVILDLGLARSMKDSSSAQRLEGTPMFMAPEQLQGSPASPQSDLFSLGLMLWQALTGAWPYPAPAPSGIPRARIDADLPSLSSVVLDLPGSVASAIDAMLCRDPGRRSGSALDCIRKLMSGRACSISPKPEFLADRMALATLFAGPERLLHFPSSIASLLWARTAGDADRISRTIETWVALGILHEEAGQFRMSRTNLDRFLAGWTPESEPGSGGKGPAWGSPLALLALLAERDDSTLPQAALATAESERAKGNIGSASACIREGLRACWQSQDLDTERKLIAAAFDLALRDRSASALDIARDLIGRSRVRDAEAIELLRAARALQDGRRDEAMPVLDRPCSSSDSPVEIARHDLRVQAVVDGPLDRERLGAVRNDIELWASRSHGAPRTRAHLGRWRSRLLYREGHMRESAMEAEASSNLEPAPFDQIHSLLSAAASWIEAADIDRTFAIATRARILGAELRLPLLEARAEWLLRSLANRTGSTTEPDLELIDAARHLDNPQAEGLIVVTEAAIAWRNKHSCALDLARHARECFEAAGYGAAALFARALEIASGQADPEATQALASEACSFHRPDVAIEVLGVLATSGGLVGDWRRAFEEQERAVSIHNPDWRSGVLSLNEAKAAVAAASGSFPDRSTS